MLILGSRNNNCYMLAKKSFDTTAWQRNFNTCTEFPRDCTIREITYYDTMFTVIVNFDRRSGGSHGRGCLDWLWSSQAGSQTTSQSMGLMYNKMFLSSITKSVHAQRAEGARTGVGRRSFGAWRLVGTLVGRVDYSSVKRAMAGPGGMRPLVTQ